MRLGLRWLSRFNGKRGILILYLLVSTHYARTAGKTKYFPLAGLCIGCLLVFVSPAFGQTELGELSDDAVIEQIHRSEFKEEFERRMTSASPEERMELARKRAKQPRERDFPVAYTDDELIELACRRDDAGASTQALEELRARYSGADQEKVAVLEGKLRAACATLQLPQANGASADERALLLSAGSLFGISEVAAACLPEERALAVLWDVHIASRPTGGVGRFLSHLSGPPFTGQATVDSLLALRNILKTEYTTREAYATAGESESIATVLISRLPQCGKPGFDALKSIGWDSPAGIQAMGYVGTEESRQLLLDLYEKTDPTHLEDRIQIVSALAGNLRETPDPTLREFVRTELTEILLGDHFDRLPELDRAVQVAGSTRDPYFIDPLRKLARELTPPRIPEPSATIAREARAVIVEANEMNYRMTHSSLEESIEKLEKVKQKSE